MAERRTGLGKGLGALIPPGPSGGQGDGQNHAGGSTLLGTGGAKKTRRPVDLLFTSSTGPGDAPSGQAVTGARDGGRDQEREGRASGGDAAGSADTTSPGEMTLVAVPGAEFAMIPVAAISPNPRQPREVFDEEAIQELADSIKEVGLLQPVVVRPSGEPTAQGAGDPRGAGDAQQYELVMGERRWRASQLAGAIEVPAIIRTIEDSDLLRDALLENLHRAQLNPLEEAAAYRQLLDDFSCTQEELAVKVARSRPQISNTLRLLRLPPLVQRRLAAGVLSAGHARALLSLDDAAAMERMAQKIVAEGLSVRSTEELVSLGEVPQPVAKAKKATVRPGGQRRALDDLQERLADRFDTKVGVALGKSKGRITIEFASLADLNRIVQLLDPADPGVLKQ